MGLPERLALKLSCVYELREVVLGDKSCFHQSIIHHMRLAWRAWFFAFSQGPREVELQLD